MVEYTKHPKPKNRAELIKKRLNEAFGRNPKITNKSLADHCHVSEQAVYKWRKKGEIKRDNIPQVAAFFGEPPNWLLDDMTELREPDARGHHHPLTRSERNFLELIRQLPPEVHGDLEQHIKTLVKLFAKQK